MFDNRVEVITNTSRPSLALNGHELIASSSSPLVERIIQEESTLTAGEEGSELLLTEGSPRGGKTGGHNIDHGYSIYLPHKGYAILMDIKTERTVELMEPLSNHSSKYMHNFLMHSKPSALVTPKL